jgi:hypothetical protein
LFITFKLHGGNKHRKGNSGDEGYVSDWSVNDFLFLVLDELQSRGMLKTQKVQMGQYRGEKRESTYSGDGF